MSLALLMEAAAGRGFAPGAEARVRQQQTTALPEPILWLVYDYPDEKADYREVERRLHRHLNAADHN